jgi:hydroxymethylpyrimidine/phosphomethylpyrimidine kinase
MARDPSHAARRRPVCAVTIAASDSGAGAGIQADLLTFAAHGVYGATVLTAATAQNTRGVAAIEPLPARFLAKQLDAVFSDFAPRAVKIGMLYDEQRVRTVARGLKRHRARRVVLDPVMISKSGACLLARGAIPALRRDLFPLCDLVTPNLPEAESLSGVGIHGESDRRRAAERIWKQGARAVLIKGGHARGRIVRDLLFDGETLTVFSAPRVASGAVHGTGCSLSSAIAAQLALGRDLHEAVERAIVFLRDALARATFPGRGFGALGLLAAPTSRER